MCDLAEYYQWDPETIMHMTVSQLIWWGTQGGRHVSKDRIIERWARAQRRKQKEQG